MARKRKGQKRTLNKGISKSVLTDRNIKNNKVDTIMRVRRVLK